MKRRTCMCGYSTDKSAMWDDELDQCVGCTRTQNRTQKIQDYLDTFEVGDLVVWRGQDHLLSRKYKSGSRWDMLNTTTLSTHPFYPLNIERYDTSENIRDIIYKRTFSVR